MKKFLLGLFIFIAVFAVVGCNKENGDKKVNDDKIEAKSVVLYFSATGTTKVIAERIADKSNSDIIEIVPQEKYKDEDLQYGDDCRATREQNDKKSRPKIESVDISKYDTIYVGYPIWWGYAPRIIFTLLDSYDFSNKTIIPFCTSGSSNIKESVSEMKKTYPNLTIKDGKRFAAEDSDDVIIDFINNN